MAMYIVHYIIIIYYKLPVEAVVTILLAFPLLEAKTS